MMNLADKIILGEYQYYRGGTFIVVGIATKSKHCNRHYNLVGTYTNNPSIKLKLTSTVEGFKYYSNDIDTDEPLVMYYHKSSNKESSVWTPENDFWAEPISEFTSRITICNSIIVDKFRFVKALDKFQKFKIIRR